MIKQLFSRGGAGESGEPFFRRIDWLAFWSATIVSLLVYFITLGPSVTLEDSGELAVAGDHLGVPHPPGYPIWTMCAWVFARVFSWVTYRGQPTPAWSISLMSGVFAALAAGLTAMLITRSASDMLRDAHEGEDDYQQDQSDWLCWAGGVAGSLVFAFSPVMWSQATIVEVYTLNAFFLMWIFLLTYRWMRSPTDKVLWLTAFVFGLGLTNYQVLLLAALPLGVVVFLRNIALFRDFLLLGVPILLTSHLLQLGAMNAAAPGMMGPAYAKLPEMLSPTMYVGIAALLLVVTGCCVAGALSCEREWRERNPVSWLIGAGSALLIVLLMVSSVKGAVIPLEYTGERFSWALPTLILLGGLVVMGVLAATIPLGIFYAVPVAAVQIVTFVLLRKGAMHGLTHPTTWWFWWPIVWNFVLVGLARLTLPYGRTVALTALFAELGVGFYIYMPIVSDLRNPPMNWGYPRTWEGFKHAITRGQYEKLAPSDVFSSKFLFQLGSYFTDLRMQFTLLVAPLGLLPFTLWSCKTKRGRMRAVMVGAGLFVATFLTVVISEFVGFDPVLPLLGGESLRFDKIFLTLMGVLLLAGGGLFVFRQIEEYVVRVWQGRGLSEMLTTMVALLGGLLVAGYVLSKGIVSLASGDGEPTMVAKVAALGLAVLLITGVIGGWMAFRRTVGRKWDVRSDIDRVSEQWLIATATGFLVMSVLLVVLANIKGDLQDAFIQKVKFISSHGLFAIWIGYGLVLGLTLGNRLLKWQARKNGWSKGVEGKLRIGLMGLALMAATIPVFENYYNENLVFMMSGAEQNNHDFGWQFGNYQLRGAEAILEELELDEEPLPNPLFPDEMEHGAIFFGGTDPGRFVPTYMIYSADVRPDVFLITQNALADNTYMSTMRDLYGNDIWIPTPDDSANAFQVYVEEVQSGKRPKNADLVIEGGRVQVSGALGVMEINGILCDMIFKKNNARHAFYIEESYVINWMFPYLTPHGLIMKINNEKSTLTPAVVNNDLDFWDWYWRRLVRDPMFRRDLPGQKSFSKLRSAVAGLYASRGMRSEAEHAFREARILYPVSPEANFRLIQEVLLPQGRSEEAITILEEFNKRDPNNERGHGFVNYIKRVRETEARAKVLSAKVQQGQQLSVDESLELALALRDLGQSEAAANYLEQLAGVSQMPAAQLLEVGLMLAEYKRLPAAVKALDAAVPRLPADIPPERLLDIVRVYGQAGGLDKAGPLLYRYLQQRPRDWEAWLDYAALCAVQQQVQHCQYAMRKAVEIGKRMALQRIYEYPQLREVAQGMLPELMQLSGGGLGGMAPGQRR